jgi:hypothetical protein
MMTITRILVPVVFSEHYPFVLPQPGRWYVPLPEGYRDGLRQDAESQVQGLLTPAEQERYHAAPAVAFGNPYAEILDYVRSAPCPVLTVR